MNITNLTGLLSEMRSRLAVSPLAENKTPLQHNPDKMNGAKRRLKNLYGKLTKGRGPETKIQATGAKR